jgi:threonine dehydrogenase-like Zn-dependent dehydrogenase
MRTSAQASGHVTRMRGSAGGGAGASGSWASRPRVDAPAGLPVASTRIRSAGRAFFWSAVTQQVARATRAFPFHDVSAAVAGAGAFALWALALALLAV